MASYSTNTIMKVNRSITGATTVNANCYAVVTYNVTSLGAFSGAVVAVTQGIGVNPVNRYFGPGASIPSTFTSLVARLQATTIETANMTYSLMSGVEFINAQ